MNLKVPGAILPLGCAILSTRAITVRGGWYNPPLRRTRVKHSKESIVNKNDQEESILNKNDQEESIVNKNDREIFCYTCSHYFNIREKK